MDLDQVKVLLQRYQAGECTLPEKQLVEQWYNQLIETGEWNWSEAEKLDLEKIMENQLLQQINHPAKPQARTNFFHITGWWAAAAVILLLGAGTFLLFNKVDKPVKVAKTVLAKDINAPESNRALITLASGQKLYLDSALNGALVMQGNVKLIKQPNGEIVYQAPGKITAGAMEYNTLVNPQGSKVINLTLADGTKLWLNAGSSLTYPVAFVGNERKVAITGEAYFEVAHNSAIPFKVMKGEMEVTVLGTHFNISAYNDEDIISTTLIEGSVKVSKGKMNIVLQPGQQSQLIDQELKIIKNVNIEQITSWKDGWFYFESADLKTILRQFSRWYDVKVIYEGNISNRKFFGIVKRSSSLQTVLEMLQDNDIIFRIEGKNLFVKSS